MESKILKSTSIRIGDPQKKIPKQRLSSHLSTAYKFLCKDNVYRKQIENFLVRLEAKSAHCRDI